MSERNGTLDARKHLLPQAESQRIFCQHIEPMVLGDCRPAEAPEAIVFGSHLGCATAAAMRLARDSLGGAGSAVEIVLGDLRAFHPHYAELASRDTRLATFYTDVDALKWLEMLLDAAIEAHMPLVLQGAMLGQDGAVGSLLRLQRAGYHVEARALAVPAPVSWQTLLQVQELARDHTGAARPVTPGAHQASYDGLPPMLDRVERERLADVVTVFDRHGHCCYRHDLATGERTGAGNAVTALHVHRALPLALGELRSFHGTYRVLEQRLQAPERHAGNEDLLRIESLRWESHCALLSEAFVTLPEAECVREFPQLAEAFERLREAADTAAQMPDPAFALLLAKKARETFARRIANGNFGVAGVLPF